MGGSEDIGDHPRIMKDVAGIHEQHPVAGRRAGALVHRIITSAIAFTDPMRDAAGMRADDFKAAIGRAAIHHYIV